MRMMYIFKSNKYRSMICRFHKIQEITEKLKSTSFFFVKYIYIESAISKVGSWSFKGVIILLIYFLNCRKALLQRNK